MRRVLAVLFVVLLLVLGAAAAWRVLERRPGPLPADADLVVPHGSRERVARFLQDQHVLADGATQRLLFELTAVLTDRHAPLHAAELHFPAHVSPLGVLAILRHARPVQHPLTVAEGLTAAQIVRLVAQAPFLQGSIELPPEGALLPETYDCERGTSREALIGRMRAAMRRVLDKAWASRDPDLPLASPEQMLILASIVERETGVAAERPMVAEVFLNRLRQGMKLQSDATIAYAASGGTGNLPRPLTRADLAQPGPYNSYLEAGLPPSPIASPGEAAIEAVAHPAHGDLLYFVATGSGGHAFSADLADHLRHVAALRAVEAAHPADMPSLDPLRPPPQVPAEHAGRR